MFPAPFEALSAAVPHAVGHATSAALVPVAPQAWTGKTMTRSYGLATTVSTRVMAVSGGTSVEVTVGAELDTSSIVILVVLLVLFWPVALVLGYLGYDDFTKRRAYAMHMVWQNLAAAAGTQPSMYGVNAPPRGPAGFGGGFG